MGWIFPSQIPPRGRGNPGYQNPDGRQQQRHPPSPHQHFPNFLTMGDKEEVCKPCHRSTMPSKSRCKYCYRRERMKDPTAKSVEIKKRCANPTNGCVVCNQYVCMACWDLHVDEVKHRKANPESNKRPKSKSGGFDKFKSGSVVMESLFATNNINWSDFLSRWGKEPTMFTYHAEIMPITLFATEESVKSIDPIPSRTFIPALYGGDGIWRETSMDVFPLREIIRQGWHIFTVLMNSNRNGDGTVAAHVGSYCQHTMVKISVLLNQQLKTRDEILRLYSGDLWEAYLSGCSISWENCDLLSPHIAALCQDLQGQQEQNPDEERGQAFHQTHVSAHVNPPRCFESQQRSQNDRNVIVFQLVGRRYWKLSWNTTTVKDLSSSEAKKASTSESKASSDRKPNGAFTFADYLYPGDILYIPKGMSYECHAHKPNDGGISDPSISFHVAIALDKSPGLISETIENMVKDDLMKDPPSAVVPDAPSSSLAAKQDTADEESEKQDPGTRLYTGCDNDVEEDPGTRLYTGCGMKEEEDPGTRVSTGSGENENQDSGARDYMGRNVALSQRRSMLIREEQKRTPDWKKNKKLHHPKEIIKSEYLDIVGPLAASTVNFLTIVRCSSPQEQKRGLKLYENANRDRNDQKWSAGVRTELMSVASVISSRFLSVLIVDGQPVSPRRAIDVCQLVRNTFKEESDLSLVCDPALLAWLRREVEIGNVAIIF